MINHVILTEDICTKDHCSYSLFPFYFAVFLIGVNLLSVTLNAWSECYKGHTL